MDGAAQPDLRERFRRAATSPASDRLPLMGLIISGAILSAAPKAVGLVDKVMLPEFVPIQIAGLVLFALGILALAIPSRFLKSAGLRRTLLIASMAIFLTSLLSPFLCLLAYLFGETGPAKPYYVTRDPDMATYVLLIDREGHQTEQSAWRPPWLARAHECIIAAPVDGALGMHWVKIVGMTPRPQRGGLWWDYPASTCFAARNLADLVER